MFAYKALAATMTAGIAIGAAAPALASGPSDQASCAALFKAVETGSIWPTRAQLAQIVQQTAAEQGTSPGQLYSAFAQNHAGVYAQCDLFDLGVPLP